MYCNIVESIVKWRSQLDPPFCVHLLINTKERNYKTASIDSLLIDYCNLPICDSNLPIYHLVFPLWCQSISIDHWSNPFIWTLSEWITITHDLTPASLSLIPLDLQNYFRSCFWDASIATIITILMVDLSLTDHYLFIISIHNLLECFITPNLADH